MKIALFDPYNGKFTREMQLWWQARGDEVRFSQYYNPANVIWADVVWFDTADNNIMSGSNPGSAILDDASNFSPWDMHDMDLSEKRVIVRPIDIEVWQGHMEGVKWDVVDEVIFIADHIRSIINENELNLRREDMGVHTIECGVAIDKWKYREHQKGFNIAVVGERWMSKGEAYVLQIAMKLKELDPRYKIHWLGKRSDYQWEHAYFDEFIEHFQLPIEITNYADSVDEFLEDKDYILSASHKEAFGYNIAEGMAKGLKPVIHRFYGADKLWPGLTWNTIDEAVAMITEDKYDSASYLQYLIDHNYTMDLMMDRIDKIIKGEY